MIIFKRTDSCPRGFITVGYWSWSKPKNRGDLIIEVIKMSSWRFEGAVWGHEIIEAIYCWLFGITTEKCDEFDIMYEEKYESGEISPDKEPGCDRNCPYHIGHMAGIVWEWLFIHLTFASWKRYNQECNKIMGI
jgi:hypothetical protein